MHESPQRRFLEHQLAAMNWNKAHCAADTVRRAPAVYQGPGGTGA
ncbi:hypothetical protein [Glutamicibacter sp. NPDC087583]